MPDSSFCDVSTTPGLYIGGNSIRGATGASNMFDMRYLIVGGTAASPALVEGNWFHHLSRVGHIEGYVTFRGNRFGIAVHHGFTGSSVDDLYITDIRYENNRLYGECSAVSNFVSRRRDRHRLQPPDHPTT